MRTLRGPLTLCFAIASSIAGTGCATSVNDLLDDGGIGPIGPTTDSGATVAPDTGGGVVIVGQDSGLPTVTITSDGGRSSLEPTVDAGTTPPSGDSGVDNTGDASSFPPPSSDSGTTFPSSDGAAPTDGGHHHHDAGSGSGSGTSTGSGSGTGTAPATCSGANGATGCCVGNTRYYCSEGSVATDDCTEVGKVCGWSNDAENYGCVTGPAETDPSGANPLTCGGSSGSGSGAGGAPTSCASVDYAIGCCQGNTNYFCENKTSTTVESQACPSGTTCGWGTASNGASYYGCVTGGAGQSAPGDEYPIACQ